MHVPLDKTRIMSTLHRSKMESLVLSFFWQPSPLFGCVVQLLARLHAFPTSKTNCGAAKLSHVPNPRSLGSLHTQAKSRDHDIVRAQKKVSKCGPNTNLKSCSVVTDP